jgi:NAD(P)-dependent dehydrogenase (short-subunit alcohol dehydrogenase family)
MSWRISMAGFIFAASSALSASAADKPASPQQAPAPTVVVTGANRGIGFEFAKQYAGRGWNVIATTRRPDPADPLGQLAASNPRVKVEQVDVADVASVDAFAARLKGVPVDVLVNNAGIFGETKDVMGGRFNLGNIDFSQFDKFFRTNALGPLKVTEALLPNLRAGAQKKVVAVTSLAGSFDYNLTVPQMPGHYFYKGSKAALDMFILTMAQETRKEGLVVAALSPGQVDTRNAGLKKMGMPGIVDIDQSVGGMIKVIDGMQAKDSGGYFRWSGEPAKW